MLPWLVHGVSYSLPSCAKGLWPIARSIDNPLTLPSDIVNYWHNIHNRPEMLLRMGKH
jgi:hypothetical protein